MQVRKIPTLPVAPARAKVYLQRARELHELAQEAQARQLWQGLALLSLELVVVLADAVLVRERGFRPRSADPRELPELLTREVPYLPELEDAVGHARRVLMRTGLLDHEARSVGKSESCKLMQHAEAFRGWALGHIEG